MATTKYIVADIIRETAKAMLVDTIVEVGPKYDKDFVDGEVWLPKSKVSVYHRFPEFKSGEYILAIPGWLSYKNNLASMDEAEAEEFMIHSIEKYAMNHAM